MHWIRIAKPFVAAKLGFLSVLCLGVASQPYRLVVVQGNSMWPTYQDQSIHLAKYKPGPLYHGEVVVLTSPVGTLVKRIAFLPGDTMQQLNVGGDWVDIVNFRVKPNRFLKVRTVKIPPGKVYVLGDNRSKSIDSTSFGALPIKNIYAVLVDQKQRSCNAFEWCIPDDQISDRA